MRCWYIVKQCATSSSESLAPRSVSIMVANGASVSPDSPSQEYGPSDLATMAPSELKNALNRSGCAVISVRGTLIPWDLAVFSWMNLFSAARTKAGWLIHRVTCSPCIWMSHSVKRFSSTNVNSSSSSWTLSKPRVGVIRLYQTASLLIQPVLANSSTALSKYKVVRVGQFPCNELINSTW